jgi:hypothetical protein
MKMRLVDSVLAVAAALSLGIAGQAQAQNATYKVPRTPDGLPDLQGIWQVRDTTAAFDVQDHAGALGIPPGRSIVVQPADGKIPYKPEALAKRQENFKNRDAADTLNKCYMPGVPRINYLNFPFQIFETPKYTLIAYEYIHNYRTIFTNGTQHLDGLDWWMAIRWWWMSPTSTTRPGSTLRATITAASCTWWSGTPGLGRTRCDMKPPSKIRKCLRSPGRSAFHCIATPSRISAF